MQTFVQPVTHSHVLENTGTPLIFNMIMSALSNVPFHKDTGSITRFIAEDFPLHLAIHEVSPVILPPSEYTEPHIHDDFDEVNIILSPNSLLYKIQLGEEEYTVNNNSAIWIPKGMLHSANVLRGWGYFITLRINQGN
jgi:hypothetical protein